MAAEFAWKFVQIFSPSVKLMFEYFDKYALLTILILILSMVLYIFIPAYYLYKMPLQRLIFVSLWHARPLIIAVLAVSLFYNILVYPALKVIYSSRFDVKTYVQLDRYLHLKMGWGKALREFLKDIKDILKFSKNVLRGIISQRKYTGFIVIVIHLQSYYLVY